MRLRQHDRHLGLAVGDEGASSGEKAIDGTRPRCAPRDQAEGVAEEAEGGVGVVDEDVHGAE